MQISEIEKLMMNNPIRVWVQRKFEAPRMFEKVRLPPKSTCLEIGCGRGIGALLINQNFKCCKLVAIDLDPKMIERAKIYLFKAPGWAQDIRKDNIGLKICNATSLPFPDNSFDAIFAFGILHHIENWPEAISETYRVLKPKGYFSFEEFFFGPLLKLNLVIAKRFGINPYIVIPENEFRAKFEYLGFKFITYRHWFGLPFGCFAVAIKT